MRRRIPRPRRVRKRQEYFRHHERRNLDSNERNKSDGQRHVDRNDHSDDHDTGRYPAGFGHGRRRRAFDAINVRGSSSA